MKLGFDDTENTVYVADTNALIKLEMYYPPSYPAFSPVWDEFENLIKVGRLRIIDYVEIEINDYNGAQDFIKKFTAKNKKAFVYKTTAECYIAARPIINDEYSTGFFDSKKQALGKEEADPYLIAYCKVNNCTLISMESKTRHNKIPAVAKKNGVRCIDIYDFLSELGFRMSKS